MKLFLIVLIPFLLNAQIIQRPFTAVDEGGAESEVGEIFADDFSDGDISDWVQIVGSGNTITLEDSGSFYCVRFHYDSSQSLIYMGQVLETVADSMFMRFEVWIPSDFWCGITGTYSPMDLFTFTEAADTNTNYARYRPKGGNPNQINRANVRLITGGEDDSTPNAYTAYDDKWTRFECGYYKGTGSDGWAEILLDGNGIQCLRNDGEHSTITTDKIIFGNYNLSGTPVVPSGDLWIRYVRIDSSGYPGAYGL